MLGLTQCGYRAGASFALQQTIYWFGDSIHKDLEYLAAKFLKAQTAHSCDIPKNMVNIPSDMPEHNPKDEAPPEKQDEDQQEEQTSGSKGGGGDIEQQKVQEEEIPGIKTGKSETSTA